MHSSRTCPDGKRENRINQARTSNQKNSERWVMKGSSEQRKIMEIREAKSTREDWQQTNRGVETGSRMVIGQL